jgi:hypothetical protein
MSSAKISTILFKSNLAATFSETIARGTGDIVIKESDGTIFETLGIQHANITIGGTDNKTLTINPSANLESGKSYTCIACNISNGSSNGSCIVT